MPVDELALLVRNRMLDAITRRERDEREYQGLSSTGYCLRKQYYALAPEAVVTNAPSARGRWEMEDGYLHEADIARTLRDAGYTLHYNTDGEEGNTVLLPLPRSGRVAAGHIDGEADGPDLFLPALVEAKSMAANRYCDAVLKGVQYGHHEYWMQTQGYLRAGAGRWRFCLFIVKAKDSSQTVQRLRSVPNADPKLYVEVIYPDPTSQLEVIERQEVVGEALNAAKPPPREYKLSNWQCQYCDYKDFCWSDER